MSVVNADWRDPASWRPAKLSYGFVRDGDSLRVCRREALGKSTFWVCGVAEWQSGSEFRQQLERDLESGAGLAVGIEPHRVMLRRLNSPLRDAGKSAEIWETLLDAAIPFALEKCEVSFLPLDQARDSGRSCLAVAARQQDLEECLAEWQALGLDPDALFPEELLLPGEGAQRLWLGETRTVFSVWEGKQFAGGGGALKPEMREKVITRFEQSQPAGALSADWDRMGPDSDNLPHALEEALAAALQRPEPLHANLRANHLAAPRPARLYARKQKTLKVGLGLTLLLLLLFPLMLRNQLRAYQNLLRAEISQLYQDLTGGPSNAPGQELLLARRFLQEKWGTLWTSMDHLSDTSVSRKLEEIFRLAAQQEVLFQQIDLQPDRLDLQVTGAQENLALFVSRLRDAGWEVQAGPGLDGGLHIYGSRSK